jgi:mono/diheme cytochrome c family protein
VKRAALLLLGLLAALAGCDLSMDRQPKYGAEAKAPLWPDAMEAQPLPAGVVEVGAPAGAAPPPPITPALMARGAARYAIFCQPCHGASGAGDGPIVGRGFPAPPTLAAPQAASLTGAQVFAAISDGYGVMYPFASRISPADRWAITAYVRALQVAGRAGEDVSGPSSGNGRVGQ